MNGAAYEEVRLLLEKYKYPPQMIGNFRAEVLREAADALDESETLREFTDDHMGDINAATNELRRMADALTVEHHIVDGVKHLCHAGDHYCPRAGGKP